MDAQSFNTYLKETLVRESKKYEGNLLSANYETMGEAKRAGGIYDTLVGVSNSLDKVLSDFYAQGGSNAVIETSPDA